MDGVETIAIVNTVFLVVGICGLAFWVWNYREKPEKVEPGYRCKKHGVAWTVQLSAGGGDDVGGAKYRGCIHCLGEAMESGFGVEEK